LIAKAFLESLADNTKIQQNPSANVQCNPLIAKAFLENLAEKQTQATNRRVLIKGAVGPIFALHSYNHLIYNINTRPVGGEVPF